jgi:hypothetical protein
MVRAIEPKMQRSDKNDPNSPMEQARDKDGALKWTVILSVETKSFGDKSKFDDIPVTIVNPTKPAGGVEPGRYVTCTGMELGIMVQGQGRYSFFYSAQAIRQVVMPTPQVQAQPQAAAPR